MKAGKRIRTVMDGATLAIGVPSIQVTSAPRLKNTGDRWFVRFKDSREFPIADRSWKEAMALTP
jgi:hypothetical protein